MHDLEFYHLHADLNDNEHLNDIRPLLQVHLITNPEVNDCLCGYLSAVYIDPIDRLLNVEPVSANVTGS